MPYADTDFFLALLKDSDRLESKAGKIYGKYEGSLWTSVATVVELMLLAKRFEMDVEELVVNLSKTAEIRGVDVNVVLLAAHFIKHYKINVFYAFHAAFCGNDAVISSDEVFDKLCMARILL